MIFPRTVATKWKPVVWMQKGSYEGSLVVDRVQGSGSEKDHHVWGQDVAGMTKLGGGSAAVAALRSDRFFIGCDTDPNCITTVLNRIESLPGHPFIEA